MIDKFTEIERNQLLRLHLVPLLDKTIDALIKSDRRDLASEWDAHHGVLVTLVTSIREDIFADRVKRKRDKGDA